MDLLGQLGAGHEFDHGGDALAEALVGHAHHHRVAHLRQQLHAFLDFLGEDLLAAGVDARRAAAEQLHRAVGVPASPVADERESPPVDDAEGLGRLLRVFVIGRCAAFGFFGFRTGARPAAFAGVSRAGPFAPAAIHFRIISMSPALRKVPSMGIVGSALPWPAMSGAEPCTGSNMLG